MSLRHYAEVTPVQAATELLPILAAKIGVTAAASASGLVGGVFAPSLYLGAATGQAVRLPLRNRLSLTGHDKG